MIGKRDEFWSCWGKQSAIHSDRTVPVGLITVTVHTFIAHARNGYISTSGVKSGVTIVLLRLPRSHSVEQSVHQHCVTVQTVTEHISAADEDSSVWSVINATWRALLWRFSVILAPDMSWLTYLLTYLLRERRGQMRVRLKTFRPIYHATFAEGNRP